MEMGKKKGKIIWPVLLVFCVFGAVTGLTGAQPAKAYAAPAAAVVGVVDFDRLLNQHPDMQKANEAYKAEAEQAKKEFDAKAAGLNDAQKQNLNLQLTQRMAKKRQELLVPIINKISAAVRETAEAKGLSIVVQKSSVVFGGLDITDDVLRKITGK